MSKEANERYLNLARAIAAVRMETQLFEDALKEFEDVADGVRTLAKMAWRANQAVSSITERTKGLELQLAVAGAAVFSNSSRFEKLGSITTTFLVGLEYLGPLSAEVRSLKALLKAPEQAVYAGAYRDIYARWCQRVEALQTATFSDVLEHRREINIAEAAMALTCAHAHPGDTDALVAAQGRVVALFLRELPGAVFLELLEELTTNG